VKIAFENENNCKLNSNYFVMIFALSVTILTITFEPRPKSTKYTFYDVASHRLHAAGKLNFALLFKVQQIICFNFCNWPTIICNQPAPPKNCTLHCRPESSEYKTGIVPIVPAQFTNSLGAI
jgi:uncharacterized membrane protein